MKKNILITGANSYVGTNVEKWLLKEPDKYFVETLDMKDSNWKKFDFSKFDVVFHVAGIAHVSNKKHMKELYYKVNRDLAVDTAIKSKKAGVRQFIFMSSMIVYNFRETKITEETQPNPSNFYGQSKLDAEITINSFHDRDFRVAIMRPPMIYGFNSKGNFPKLVRLAKRILIFPNLQNKRSMLYINNLSQFIQTVIDETKVGVLFPQNIELSCTTDIIKQIASINNRKIWFTKIANPILIILIKQISFFNKVFGDFYYDIKKDIMNSFTSLKDSIFEIERVNVDE